MKKYEHPSAKKQKDKMQKKLWKNLWKPSRVQHLGDLQDCERAESLKDFCFHHFQLIPLQNTASITNSANIPLKTRSVVKFWIPFLLGGSKERGVVVNLNFLFWLERNKWDQKCYIKNSTCLNFGWKKEMGF